MGYQLTEKEFALKLKLGTQATHDIRSEPIGEYDAGLGLSVEYILLAAKAVKAGDVKTAFTLSQLAVRFQKRD